MNDGADMFDAATRFPVAADKARPGDGPKVASFTADVASLPARVEPTLYRLLSEPTWFQRGEECTGFALAAAVNFLSRRVRLVELDEHALPTHTAAAWRPPSPEMLQTIVTDRPSVSPRMMYEMAQVFDLEDDTVEGSTLLGALSGWWRCGVTTQELWPYAEHDDHGERHGTWTVGRISDARTRQLEWSDEQRAIASTDLEAMQAALAANDVLYVDAEVHDGWFRPLLPGVSEIPAQAGDKGFHAFLIVGYDERGFCVHNSWGRFWGDNGYALLPYEDWLANGRGVWVPSFGGGKTSRHIEAQSLERSEDFVASEMWSHIVALDDEGRLSSVAPYEATSDTVRSLFYVFEQEAKARNWKHPRLLVYADDGSRPRSETIERLAKLREPLMEHEIFPIFVVWDVPWLPDLDQELHLRDREGEDHPLLGADDLETDNEFAYWYYEKQAAHSLAVQMWRAVQARAWKAAALTNGGARILAQRIAEKAEKMDFELHVAAHGAGDFLASELAFRLPEITSVELFAPATTVAQFQTGYDQLLRRDRVGRITITVSADVPNGADTIGAYPMSVLHLASRVLAVDGIDDPDRSVGTPAPGEADDDLTDVLEADFNRWSAHVRTTEAGLELLAVEPILGLRSCIEDTAGLAAQPDRVAVTTVAASHFDVPSNTAMWSEAIERIGRSAEQRSPEETSDAEPPPASPWPTPARAALVEPDLPAPGTLTPGIRQRDPLRIQLDRLSVHDDS